MLDFTEMKIYLACGSTDFRKSINGLAAKVQQELTQNPFEQKALYVFCNKSRNRLKLLEWDSNGFWLYYKRLEHGTLKWPNDEERVMELSADELALLLDSTKLVQKLNRKELNPKYAV
jgi:transposase